MPRFDQTGPEGEGSMTGRKMGKCTNFGGRGSSKEADPSTGAEEILPGRGLGRRLGLGTRGAGQGAGQGAGLGAGLGAGKGAGKGAGRGAGRRRGGGQGLQNRFRNGQQ